MDGSTRNAVHKMRSMRFADSKDARSLRIEKHNDNRRMARQAKSNAHRGLAEINLNTFPKELEDSVVVPTVELTHEQKLQDRLNKLKLWREEKAAAQKKEKARKKAPFIVPCHSMNAKPEKSEKPGKEAPVFSVKTSERTTRSQAAKGTSAGLTKPVERLTRSQAKKSVNDVKKTPAPTRATNRAKKLASAQKWEVQSFAPTNFVFSAPQGIALKGLEVVNPPDTTASPADDSKTPQKPKASESPAEEIKISPLLANNPWITMTRGSSSKKSNRKSLDPTNATVADLQASPALKRRSMKPEEKEPAEPKDPRDAAYFRALVSLEESRLTALCDMWEGYLAADVPEEESGTVRTVIGQAHLLQRERFGQFCGLIDQFENKTGEKEITPTDLEGFWEMIYLQVTDVDRKFGELNELRDNGWVRKAAEKKERPKRKAKEVAAAAVARPPRAVRSNLRAHIAAARKNQLMAKSPKSPSVNRRRSSLLCSPHRTPGKRQSLRRSALILSAKKQMFIVTDMTNPEDEPRISQYTPAAEETAPQTERLSVPDDSAGVKCPTPSRRRSSKKSLKADLLAADASPTCQNKAETREPMDCDDVVLPDEAVGTPLMQKTYGKSPRSVHDPDSKSPEERLSEAFDALKAEDSDKATPLKVFRTPCKVGRKYQRKSIQFTESETIEKQECDSPVTAEESDRCRRSSRLRTKEDKGGRPSLLPTIAVSPAEAKDDLMSFD